MKKNSKPSGSPIVTLAEVKRRAIFEALDKCDGDATLAAKHLGIAKTTVYRFLETNPYTKPDKDDHSEFLDAFRRDHATRPR
jgi:DNA-binding NtrC family response regulator